MKTCGNCPEEQAAAPRQRQTKFEWLGPCEDVQPPENWRIRTCGEQLAAGKCAERKALADYVHSPRI